MKPALTLRREWEYRLNYGCPASGMPGLAIHRRPGLLKLIAVRRESCREHPTSQRLLSPQLRNPSEPGVGMTKQHSYDPKR